MENKEKKIIKIIIVIILGIVLAVLIGVAYARFMTLLHGQSEMNVAKWSFKVVDGNPETVDVLDFPITRTDSNTDAVDSSTIGPGTYGEFEVEIDPRGTETDISYEIKIGVTNKPTNMKFYLDEEKTNEIRLDNQNNLILNGYIGWSDTGSTKTRTIYWDWPFTSGTVNSSGVAEGDAQDIIDMQMDKIRMAITVTGVQAVSEGVTVTFDKNYFEDDLLQESFYIKNYYNHFLTQVKSFNIINNEYAKYGKSVKIFMRNTPETSNDNKGGMFINADILEPRKSIHMEHDY